ncbi:hypothetical protein [Deminuibacter soli]|uniref:Uncharacterized protein n=1 Tax=Deminuibacter soli TaxID=2291815 RepID=A0A3E1NHR8_9BACT|nr:hypothetical protein [Deminuibacter soli]RFM27493.1 hypothetical protein DXN05_15900 [Deminuibacter soli]
MATPTPEQVKIVQQNLVNMQAFNGYIFSHGKPCILNAYLLLTIQDNNDPGLAYGLSFFEAAFAALAGELGALGALCAGYLNNVINNWLGNPPNNLNQQFASLVTRFNQTSIDIDAGLAGVHDDLNNPARLQQTWDSKFTFNGRTVTMGDMASEHFPSEIETPFINAAKKAIKAIDRSIWKQMLVANYWIPYRGQYRTDYKDKNVPPIPYCEDVIKSFKSCECSYFWHQGGGGDCSLWIVVQYDIELKNVSGFYNLPDAACDYVFIDSMPGKIINADGLFTRGDVAQFLGIKIINDTTATNKRYITAVHEGKTLMDLFNAQGRAAIEQQVIQNAKEDPIFAIKLTRDANKTLEEFFDIVIPPHFKLTVVIEDPMNFGLVIPAAKMAEQVKEAAVL